MSLGTRIAAVLSPGRAVDSLVGAFSPVRALKRAYARSVLASYEGGRSTKRRKKNRDNSSGERLVVRDAATVRATMRDLERNHDLLRGALLTLSRTVIGPGGISIEPMPRVGTPGSDNYDDIDDDFARDILNLWREWTISPEVTRTMTWLQAQELACRSWLRDGEMFTQLVEGNATGMRHGSRVPLSLELLEADVVPLDYERDTNVQAGIERNEWGQPLAFYVYKRHPGNGGGFSDGNLKRVPADRFLHLAIRERLSGLRGISVFASSIDRLLDIKDYEESERTAARIAARIAAFVKRDVNMGDAYVPPTNPDGTPADRDFLLEAGAIFTDLAPGESIEMVNPNRPNTALGEFRRNMLRAASRPAQLSYSSFAGDYDGTYSAQRQELVESYDGTRMLTQQFVGRFIQPVYERFIAIAIASGVLRVPAHIRPETVAQADFRGPKMPWIDPKKEAEAMVTLRRAGLRSLQQLIAESGGRLQDVFEQLHRENNLADELGLVLDSDARNTVAAAPAPAAAAVDETDDPTDMRDAARTRQRARRPSPSPGATH